MRLLGLKLCGGKYYEQNVFSIPHKLDPHRSHRILSKAFNDDNIALVLLKIVFKR